MNLNWNVAPENDLASGNVGVVITASAGGVAVQDLVSATWARQFAAQLLMAAEQISPMISAKAPADESQPAAAATKKAPARNNAARRRAEKP